MRPEASVFMMPKYRLLPSQSFPFSAGKRDPLSLWSVSDGCSSLGSRISPQSLASTSSPLTLQKALHSGSQSVSYPLGSTFQMTLGEAQLGQVTYIQNQHPCTWGASG